MEKDTDQSALQDSVDRSAIAKQLGSLGGKATASKGKEYMSNLGKLGAKKRWGDKTKV